ncbi:unnamed protein product [Rotaria magnacalcarata]|uniref:Reverse transcriptase n=2 Tax=Rotaria magnacalcarata TaxID=392030 RepID=A0A816M4Q1_9BILA|nr:unnamed protein product [Rotaria magnacalcarata]
MLRRKFTPRINVVRDQDGKMLPSQCGSLYKDHGGGDNVVRHLNNITPMNTEESQEILYSEVKEAIRSLKKNKSAGPDGIPAEMLQAGGEPLEREIHKLCNKAWQEGTIPDEWANPS